MVSLKTLTEKLDLKVALSESELATAIQSLSSLDSAGEGEISFLSSKKYRRVLSATKASAVLVTGEDAELCPEGCIALVVDDPYLAFAKISHDFATESKIAPVIHPSAIIDSEASLGENVSVGPYAVIEKGAVIADGVIIGAHCFIGEQASVGRHSRLHHRVTLAHHCVVGENCQIFSGAVIGSDGFGYAPTETGWYPIAQIGRTVIGDRVEIGANTTIDRGAIDDTVIESDVIIDNQIMIGHNVKVGSKTVVVAQVGIAGSTEIGKNCTIGGQSGFAGHLKIADGSFFAGQSMVTKGTTQAGYYASGIPAQDGNEWRKMVARIRQLEKMNERLKALEERTKED